MIQWKEQGMILEPEITGLYFNSDIVAFKKMSDHYSLEWKFNNGISLLI